MPYPKIPDCLFLIVTLAAFCIVSTSHGRSYLEPGVRSQEGVASWHAPSRGSGESRTASGRRWVNSELVAAHRTLPLGSAARVINLRNRREVVVLITDRGPYVRGRILDLSPSAAAQLDLLHAGAGRVRVEPLPSS